MGYDYGQFAALVVADTVQSAQAAASRVSVKYDARTPDVSTDQLTPEDPPSVKNERGDVDSALGSGAVKLDVTYTTPVETHNPMEMHATIASWTKDNHPTTSAVNHRTCSRNSRFRLESIEVISRFIGSGFDQNYFPAAFLMAALSRSSLAARVFPHRRCSPLCHRPLTRQRIHGGGHGSESPRSSARNISTHFDVDDYAENCAQVTDAV